MAERYSSKSVNPAIFAEHLAFPTATELHARSRFMKAPMSEEVLTCFLSLNTDIPGYSTKLSYVESVILTKRFR